MELCRQRVALGCGRLFRLIHQLPLQLNDLLIQFFQLGVIVHHADGAHDLPVFQDGIIVRNNLKFLAGVRHKVLPQADQRLLFFNNLRDDQDAVVARLIQRGDMAADCIAAHVRLQFDRRIVEHQHTPLPVPQRNGFADPVEDVFQQPALKLHRGVAEREQPGAGRQPVKCRTGARKQVLPKRRVSENLRSIRMK